jgi:hypothetical protein
MLLPSRHNYTQTYLYYWACQHWIALVRHNPLCTQRTVPYEGDIVRKADVHEMSVGHEGVTVALQHCRDNCGHLEQHPQVTHTKVTHTCPRRDTRAAQRISLTGIRI